jgi:hypothetical protein
VDRGSGQADFVKKQGNFRGFCAIFVGFCAILSPRKNFPQENLPAGFSG